MKRYAIQLSYLGAAFCGWQKQKNRSDTVQAYCEQALEQIAQHPIKLICAGRTDTGVHAACQVVHFDSDAKRTVKNWQRGLNGLLPKSIRVHWVGCVSDQFHARFSALQRHYHYRIRWGTQQSALEHPIHCWVPYHLDIEAMREALGYWLGRHDFSSFRASGCQAASPIRQLTIANLHSEDHIITLHFAANAYLYHMIRNMVGALMVIGRGVKPAIYAKQLLALRDRTQAPKMASAQGLTLTRIEYPNHFDLPVFNSEIFAQAE